MLASKPPTPTEIEVTPEMADLGADIILNEPGVAEIGVFFYAPDLAMKVYRAMERQRITKRKEIAR